MKTTTKEIFMINFTQHKINHWEKILAKHDLAPISEITVQKNLPKRLQPFRNSFDASELIEGAPINQRDAVPSCDGYTTISPLDTDDILFSIFADGDKEVSKLALRALRDHRLDRHSIRANVSIHVLNRALAPKRS